MIGPPFPSGPPPPSPPPRRPLDGLDEQVVGSRVDVRRDAVRGGVSGHDDVHGVLVGQVGRAGALATLLPRGPSAPGDEPHHGLHQRTEDGAADDEGQRDLEVVPVEDRVDGRAAFGCGAARRPVHEGEGGVDEHEHERQVEVHDADGAGGDQEVEDNVDGVDDVDLGVEGRHGGLWIINGAPIGSCYEESRKIHQVLHHPQHLKPRLHGLGRAGVAAPLEVGQGHDGRLGCRHHHNGNIGPVREVDEVVGFSSDGRVDTSFAHQARHPPGEVVDRPRPPIQGVPQLHAPEFAALPLRRQEEVGVRVLQLAVPEAPLLPEVPPEAAATAHPGVVPAAPVDPGAERLPPPRGSSSTTRDLKPSRNTCGFIGRGNWETIPLDQ